jgi:putative endonuclease
MAELPIGRPRDETGQISRYPWYRRWFGRRSERAAVRFLRKLKYKIVGQNVEDRFSEIDLVAVDGRTLVVVEVRSSEKASHQELAATVNLDKQKRLTKAMLRFSRKHHLKNIPMRFDVITILWPAGQKVPDIRHYKNAFDATGRFEMHY